MALWQNQTFPTQAEEFRWYLLFPTQKLVPVTLTDLRDHSDYFLIQEEDLGVDKAAALLSDVTFSFFCLPVVPWFIRYFEHIACGGRAQSSFTSVIIHLDHSLSILFSVQFLKWSFVKFSLATIFYGAFFFFHQ